MVHDRIDCVDGGGGWRYATHNTIALFSLRILENNLFIGLIGLIYVDFILLYVFPSHFGGLGIEIADNKHRNGLIQRVR